MTTRNNAKSTISVKNENQLNASAWRPGFRQTPWTAMVSVLMMLACMGACAGIIIASNKQIVATWKIAPAVLLALLSSIWSYSLGVVLGISVAITWWRTALSGTTIESLHYIWDQGAGLKPISALRASVDARKVTLLAWLVVSVQIVNNPLLQRSTRTKVENVVIKDTMMLDMTPQLPDGWLGSIQNASSATIIGSRNGVSGIQKWWWNETILTHNETGYQCDGTCEGKVQGTGIDYTCTSTEMALDLSADENIGAVIFAINTTLSENSTGAPILVLETLYASAINNSCMATITVDTCSIEAAIVEYPIVIQNTTVTLDTEKLNNMTVVSKYVSAGDLPTATQGQGAGPLEGLNDFFGYYLAANITLLIDPSRNESIYSGGLIADLFFITDASNYDDSIFHKCGLEWSSPTEYVLDSMQDFLFRSSLLASTAADAQTFGVQRTYQALIFQSNYYYLAAALAVMLVALLAVLFLLWGWWELGRRVTLSPLETAKAFGAPTMRQVGENSAVAGILKLTGKMRVKYDSEIGVVSRIQEVRNEEGSEEHNEEE